MGRYRQWVRSNLSLSASRVITALNAHFGYETAARIAREAIEGGRSVR